MSTRHSSLPCSPSCERNAAVIGDVLVDWFEGRDIILEIGAGTGQHAARIAPRLPASRWLPTDVTVDAVTIAGWASGVDNVMPALELDVTRPADWHTLPEVDAVFSANTLHIMPWSCTSALFEGVATISKPAARVAVYGPMHENGEATSDSNALFDQSLRRRDPAMGIRDIEAVRSVAAKHGFVELAHYAMPANNNMLIWEWRA